MSHSTTTRSQQHAANNNSGSSSSFFHLDNSSMQSDFSTIATAGGFSQQLNGNKNSGLTEIGKHAVWSLSSAKAGNGVQQLRDNNLNTFWQSDGAQPHLVNIQFHKVLQVKQLSIYCNYKMDESYTPKVLSIRIGTHFHDLKEVQTLELEEPNGWVDIVLNSIDSDKKKSEGDDDVEDNDDANEKQSNGIRTNMIQLAILSNHQNGRDTHLRQVKIYGPSTASTSIHDEFNTVEFGQFSCIR